MDLLPSKEGGIAPAAHNDDSRAGRYPPKPGGESLDLVWQGARRCGFGLLVVVRRDHISWWSATRGAGAATRRRIERLAGSLDVLAQGWYAEAGRPVIVGTDVEVAGRQISPGPGRELASVISRYRSALVMRIGQDRHRSSVVLLSVDRPTPLRFFAFEDMRPALVALILDQADGLIAACSARTAAPAPPLRPRGGLSRRHVECLALIAAGETAEGVARRLDLSPHTVRDYLKAAVVRLKARSRSEAIARAVALGLIAGPDTQVK